ncbi:MAG: hypothetical protein GY910_19880 [bacterium]|nr:hypothetical protein [bacterium]
MREFEYVSRGDFVGGRLYLPGAARPRPAPLVFLTHGTGESARSESLDFALDWVHLGFAIAAIDLPLHGRRASPKLSDRLVQAVGALTRGETIDAEGRALTEEFARQSTSDLIRGIDAIGILDEVDAERIGLVGQGVGATVSAYLLAHDDRPRACVFIGGAGRFEDAELDPATRLAGRSSAKKCPTLVMAITGDPEVSPASAHALFEAAPEPKEFVEISSKAGGTGGLSEKAARRAADFLTRAFER